MKLIEFSQIRMLLLAGKFTKYRIFFSSNFMNSLFKDYVIRPLAIIYKLLELSTKICKKLISHMDNSQISRVPHRIPHQSIGRNAPE